MLSLAPASTPSHHRYPQNLPAHLISKPARPLLEISILFYHLRPGFLYFCMARTSGDLRTLHHAVIHDWCGEVEPRLEEESCTLVGAGQSHSPSSPNINLIIDLFQSTIPVPRPTPLSFSARWLRSPLSAPSNHRTQTNTHVRAAIWNP